MVDTAPLSLALYLSLPPSLPLSSSQGSFITLSPPPPPDGSSTSSPSFFLFKKIIPDFFFVIKNLFLLLNPEL